MDMAAMEPNMLVIRMEPSIMERSIRTMKIENVTYIDFNSNLQIETGDSMRTQLSRSVFRSNVDVSFSQLLRPVFRIQLIHRYSPVAPAPAPVPAPAYSVPHRLSCK